MQFYRDERFLIDTITAFIKIGLDLNETVLVILTAQHRRELYTTLTDDELRNDKLRFFDAADTLMLFMVEDRPNESQFMHGMETILRRAGDNGQTRVFGELVALLYTEGKAAAALRLEELWNILVIRHRFPLLCAYPLSALVELDLGNPTRVCQLHWHVQIQP
ncbi:MAG TPA: MEDS domain-containing protein [Nitrospiraceae bacterium]|nr:MEDS domain-containing protein [Nitrospiraceae bacterium]